MTTPATFGSDRYHPDVIDSYLRIVYGIGPEEGCFGNRDRECMHRLLDLITPPPATAQGWVACSERMPERNHFVSAWCPERRMAFQCTWDGKFWQVIGCSGAAYQSIPPITHWCPMPTMNPPEHKP